MKGVSGRSPEQIISCSECKHQHGRLPGCISSHQICATPMQSAYRRSSSRTPRHTTHSDASEIECWAAIPIEKHKQIKTGSTHLKAIEQLYSMNCKPQQEASGASSKGKDCIASSQASMQSQTKYTEKRTSYFGGGLRSVLSIARNASTAQGCVYQEAEIVAPKAVSCILVFMAAPARK